MKLELTDAEARVLKRILGSMFRGRGKNYNTICRIHSKLEDVELNRIGPLETDPEYNSDHVFYLVEEPKQFLVTCIMDADTPEEVANRLPIGSNILETKEILG